LYILYICYLYSMYIFGSHRFLYISAHNSLQDTCCYCVHNCCWATRKKYVLLSCIVENNPVAEKSWVACINLVSPFFFSKEVRGLSGQRVKFSLCV
jgi:hypothetical protein